MTNATPEGEKAPSLGKNEVITKLLMEKLRDTLKDHLGNDMQVMETGEQIGCILQALAGTLGLQMSKFAESGVSMPTMFEHVMTCLTRGINAATQVEKIQIEKIKCCDEPQVSMIKVEIAGSVKREEFPEC